MIKVRKYLPLSIVLFSLGCGLISQSISATQTPIPTIINLATDTPTETITSTPIPTATVVPTQIPSVVPTATVDSQSATQQASMGSFGALENITQYYHPIGTPLSNWQSVPVMPQATAGQEFPGNVYSYIAAATLDQARLFYEAKAQSLGFLMGPGTGYAGTGSNALHNVTFFSYGLSIYMVSFDNNPGQVIVVISKLP